MKLGAVFPQTDIGTDPEQIKKYILAIERMEFEHMVAFDHIIGKKIESTEIAGFSRYTDEHSFYEPFTLFSFGAAITSCLNFMSGIIILPQRQTALVAKQAASLDVLSGERLRLGFGIGYNEYEFEAMGISFKRRGERLERQIEIMRELWGNNLVEIPDEDCFISNGGINPRPKNGRIPVLVGAMVEGGMRRAARIGDGWLSSHLELGAIAPQVALMKQLLAQIDRPREGYSISALVVCRQSQKVTTQETIRRVSELVKAWRDSGAESVAIDTALIDLPDVDAHLDVLGEIKIRV